MTRLFTDNHRDEPAILPVPARKRWQPIRGGLLNLYLFDYEEFRYEKGHLILRGYNGTGKSRVMALQLPFLLDGHLGSNRVEPDADPSKKMDWNLLMGRHNERLGYTWIEFGRLLSVSTNGQSHGDSQGSSNTNNGKNELDSHYGPGEQFVTLGCGLSATKGSGMRDPWFFITDQRIGKDLFLQSGTGHPLSKTALTEAIGHRGKVFTTAKEYRQAVDDKLFGLGKQRYEAMVDLLIQLRKPQLSRNLDDKMLARVLGEALPPPSEPMILDVAESFRGLESDRGELKRFRSACEGVDSFLKTYRRYAQIASRRRAADARQAHSKYESATRELRQAEREHAEAGDLLTRATATLQSLDIKAKELDGRIETLRVDPKMRSAEMIRLAGEDEKQAQSDFEEAKRAAETASDRLGQRRTAYGEGLGQAESQLKKTSEMWQQSSQMAEGCELKSQHESAFSSLTLQLDKTAGSSVGDVTSSRRQIDKIVATQVKSSAQLKKRNDALANAERELTQAKKERDDAQQRVNEAIGNQRAAEEQRCGAVADFLEAYQMWRRDSDELVMPPTDDIAADIDEWSQGTNGENPIANVLRRAELDARQKLNELQARLQHQTDILAMERSKAETLAGNLERGFYEPPPLPFRADESARLVRPGAPFWSLVDFTQACPLDSRADIEAAIEAAGLLNAWVSPDGSVLTSDFADVLISAGDVSDAVSGSLLDALRPDESRCGNSCSVSDSVIEAVLRKIGYGEQNSLTWVAPNGRWRNGPLHGHCRKESARYIGRDAREDFRVRHLAAVMADLQQIEESARQLELQRRAIEETSAAIITQAKAIPDDSKIRAAASAASGASLRVIECRKGLTGAEQTVAAHQTTVDNTREGRDLDARDLGLFDWKDRLDELDRNLVDYQRLLAALWPSLEHFESLRAQCAASAAALHEAERDVALAADKRHDQQARHAKASQRLKTLQNTIGVEAQEILRELGAADKLRRDLQEEIKQAQNAEKEAVQQEARTEERIKSRGEDVQRETDNRQQAFIAFQRLCSLGLLRFAGELHDDDPSSWSVSRTVEIARQTESAFSTINHDDAAWDRVQQTVTTTIQDLNTALSQHAFTPTLSTADDLYQVTVPYQGQVRSVHELRELLAEEVSQRQLILDEREREIIENHLIGEVAAKLHEQIHQAHTLVDQMNKEIQKRPMSTGMMLKFDWTPDEELSSGIVEMCKKLLAATGTWSPAERVAIGRYLQEHIKEVRASREAGTWQEHLAEALDYRRWHRFSVMRKQDSGWKRLTKRTHGTGSGGEKAVALTIPQFAAAAAHYSSARDDAPRLILLDEAFVGIDPDMRGKCMELINVFDLDFLLTSEAEWGCYPGLPGVAIHQLSTRSGYEAVFLTRWIWNGKQRMKDESLLPPAARSEK